jgi:predicted porin
MKKSLIALAVMAAAGAASAQSSVTLFGIVDATFNHTNATAGGSVNQLGNSGYNSSRLGFRGTEDLGGGMAASFWLESAMSNDDGRAGGAIQPGNQPPAAPAANTGLNWSRRATVSLSGGWGELRLGRDYTPSFWNLTVFDPFGTNGVGTNQAYVGAQAVAPGGNTGVLVRASNQVGYFLPANLGGIYGQAGYWFGENSSSAANKAAGIEDDGKGFGARIGYGSGPFNVAAAWARTKYAVGDYTTWNIGGQWDFGLARAMAMYQRDSRDTFLAPGGRDLDSRGWLVGASVPVGAGEVRASFSESRFDLNTAGVSEPRERKLALGYVHNLSKRTALYATVARVKNSNTNAVIPQSTVAGGVAIGAANGRSTGYDIGVRHSF